MLNKDNEATKDGDLVNLALMGDVKPINHHEALMNKAWETNMKEDLATIEMNDTW